jgi:abhydrolase domain-containing protein 1/3
LLHNINQLQEKYWPTFWCFGTHGQTALANIIRGILPNLNYKRYVSRKNIRNEKNCSNLPICSGRSNPTSSEVLQMADGGEVSLDWYDEIRMEIDPFSDNEQARPIAMFFPGLTGDSQTEYIKSIIPAAHSLGYRAVAFNNRGRGGMKIKTPRLYCATNIDDMDEVLRHIKGKFANARVVATGISLGVFI